MHPYLALETVKQWHGQARTQSMMEAGKLKDATLDEAQANYRTAVENGGAQIFKAMGLGEEAVNTSFKGTTSTSRIGGVDLSDIASETASMRPESSNEKAKLINYGYYKPIP